jgi:phage terminase Nu1 subunit (DNA packaging protein)
MPKRVETVGTGELADLFGVDTDSIGVWCGQGMPHRRASGMRKFEVAKCVQWRRSQDKRDTREGIAPDEGKQRARKLAAEAELAELKIRERKGELVSMVDAERQIERVVATIRGRILAIRGRWAPRVMGLATMAEATATLDALATDVMSALSESADEIPDDGEAEAAA